jgi:Rrf2 family protein
MLSSRARYATRAMLDLSLRYDEGPVLIGDISERQNIPLKYLQQILVSLKLAGFLQSRKGPGGGYALARSPKEITLGEVVRAMDGPIAPISCVSVTNYAECGCPNPERCSLRATFKEVRDAMAEVIDHISFAEIAQKQRDADEADSSVLDYII